LRYVQNWPINAVDNHSQLRVKIMKASYIILAAFIAGFLISAQFSYAESMRVDHYEAKAYATSQDALNSLKDNAKTISRLTKVAGEIDVVVLEGIHEISYSLEAAIDKIRVDESLNEKAVNAIDEAVQAIHFASEKHKSPAVKEWSEKLNSLASATTLSPSTQKMVKDAAEFYTIVIKDHRFSPETVTVPAGQKVKLIVDNQDPTPEEFESHDLRREKIIGGHKKATIFVGPLKPGKYHFFGEFNMDSANGYVIAE
jgi:hypothetical protein